MNTTTWKNRALSVVLTVIMVFSMLPLSVFAAGSAPGTAGNPLLISSAEEMKTFRNRVNKGENTLHARLTADIDLSGEKWTPIGTNQKQYQGTFDGNCHTISGIQFIQTTDMGLFGYIGNGGTVQDLFILANKENTLSSSGILVKQNKGNIRRCSVEITAKITVGGNGDLGIIASSNKGTIKDCYASSYKGSTVLGGTWIETTVADPHIGGIAYMNLNGTIENCFFRGFLRTEKSGSSYTAMDYAIVAYMQGTVKNSYCFNPLTYNYVDSSKRTDMYKVHYIYKDEQSGYDNGDIGVHPTDFDYRDENPLTTQNGSLTWQLNNGGETGSTTNNEPWRLHKAVNGDDYDYPTLRKTDSRVFKEADGTFRIEPPHFHEIDGEQVEFTQVRRSDDLRKINDGYVCLGSDVTLLEKWKPTGKVTFCLNGHKLDTKRQNIKLGQSPEEKGAGIDLRGDAELTLINCKDDGWIGGGEDPYTEGGLACYGVAVYGGGTFNMESGCINNCSTGVIVDGGTFKMTGGEIKGAFKRDVAIGIAHRSGRLILGGHARVVDNQDFNILLMPQNGKTPIIEFDNLNDDALFGVCVGTYISSVFKVGITPILTNVSEGRIAVTGANHQQYYKNLFADKIAADPGNEVPDVDYDLYLTENGTIEIGVRGEHTHCLCGAEHKDIICKGVGVNAGNVGHLTEMSTTFETPWNPYDNLDENGNPTLPTADGSYYLTRSMTIEGDGAYKWTPAGNVNLCLNGHTITYRVTSRPVDGNYEGWIRVPADSTLTLTDCSEQGTVVCENHGSEDRWINAFRMQGGTLNLYGGTVKGFMKAVYVESGTLNMYGGTLTENCSSVGGGGVYVKSGTFNMYGGKITGNKAAENKLDGRGNTSSYYFSARNGGGVYVNSGADFTMYGGEISGNGEARGLENDEPIWRGGGVYAGGNFTMTGGKISGNSATMFSTETWCANDPIGGGVYVGGDFTMYGGEISGNSVNGKTERYSFVARGGGVYVAGAFTMNGGEITDNTVTSGVGGGVFVGEESYISNATISNNAVSFKGNDVYYKGAGGGIFANKKCDITNSKITDNRVTELKAFGISNARICSGGGGIFLNNAAGVYSTITDCIITGNTLAGATASSKQVGDRVGGGGILVCQGTVRIVGSTITGNQMTTQDGTSMLGGGILCFTATNAPVILLTGKVDVYDNTSNGKASNLYLEDPADSGESVATVMYGDPSGTVGVTKPGEQPISIAAANGFLFTAEAASHFFDDSGRYVARMTEDGTKIQLIPCPHDGGYENGICKICGEGCTHPTDKITEGAGNAVCDICGQHMAVKVEKDGVTKYYVQSFNSRGGENTLQALFNDDTITPSGSTITLLADGLLAFAFVDDGKNIKLNLNGKNLIETVNNGIAVDPGSTLTVTGEGSSTRPANLTENDSSYIFNVRGGTLEFTVFYFGGTFNAMRVGSGTLRSPREREDVIHIGTLQIDDADAQVSFKAAGFDKIVFGGTSGSVTLGDLLGVWQDSEGNKVRSGNAFQKEDGTFLRYDTVITKDTPIENVKTAACHHDSVTGRTCDYCGTQNLVAAVIDGGGSVATYAATDDSAETTKVFVGYALRGWNDNGSNRTLKLYVDAVLTKDEILNAGTSLSTGLKFKTIRVIDLNGSNFTSADETAYGVVVNELVTLTVKDGSAGKKGELANVTVNNGATLIVDGVKMGSVTLKDGCTFTDKGGSYGSITAESGKLIDFLPEGYAFVGTDGKVKNAGTDTLENVTVARHTEHSYEWNTATHEHICGCGHVDKTDTTAPTISGIADGETYYQNTLTFTVADTGSGLASVKDGGKALIRNASGEYTIPADNREHTITVTDNAGNTATVTVTVYKVYRVTLVSGTGYTVEGNPTVGHGQDYTFTVKITKGYSATRDFTVYLNGSIPLVTPDPDSAGVYTFTFPNAPQDLSFTVKGVADITAPDVEMTIGANKFKELLNSLTFGLFFKKTQTVTVTAADLGSRVDDATAEYLVIDGLFDKDTMPTEGWKSFSMNDGKGSFSIEPNAVGSVYVRIKDKDGNLALINSDGVVLYTDSEVHTDSHEFTRLSTGEVAIAVVLNGNGVKAIRCGDTELVAGTDYTVAYNSNPTKPSSITLKNDWLKTLAAGTHTITVTYAPMGLDYTPAEGSGSEAPADTTVTLTVERAPRTLEFSAPNAVYDGKAYDDLTITDRPDGTVIQYKTQGADDSTYTTDAPKNAGSYTVRITTPQDENYNAAVFTTAFTISPKKVTITGVTAASKVYDGSTVATITGTAILSDNYDGENLTVKMGKANFADKNVGTAKTVTFSGFELTGSAKDNYKLTAQPASVTADITAKEVTVSGTAVKSTKVYNGSTAAEIESIGNLDGVEDGDNLTIAKGKAAYADKNVGTGKTVTFSEFALDGADKGNYTLKSQPASVTADITAKEVTVTGTAVKSTKVYNGSTAAEIENIGNLIGVENGDDLTVVKGKAAYDTKNVGIGKTVTFSEFALDGADKDNYTLKSQPASVTADITAKEVIITGTAVKSTKVYNGSTAAEIESIGNLDGVEDGDNLTIVKGKAAYADKNVGETKLVTFSGFALDGADKNNYALKAQPASVTADITAKEVTVENLKIKTKKYDSTVKAEIDGTPGLKGVVNGDTLTLINGTPVFDSAAVGESIAVSFTAPFALAGDELTVKNYTLTQPTGITADIVAWIVSGSEYGVNSNDWINTDFTVTARTGYQISLTNTAAGNWTDQLTASDETATGALTFYVKDTATGVISSAVTESYKIDKSAPTGTITFNERSSFQKFLNTITFGLFFKEDVRVRLSADDEASGVKSAAYYKSDKALTLEEVKAVTDWKQDSSFGITAEDMAQFVIYARITDNAGNITYLSSDGAEFDTTAPEIIGVENGETYYVTRRVAADDKNLASVKVNRETKKVDSFFELAGDTDTVYTIVATDHAGNVTTCTVTMKPISDITDAIKEITEENVKSSDADAIAAVTQQILDIAAESEEDVIGEEQWNKLLTAAENCKALEQRITAVAEENTRLTDGVNAYDNASVTDTDRADIEELIVGIDALLGGNNLTDAERAAHEAFRQTAQALLDRIADAKNAAEDEEVNAVKDITKDNVTADDKDALEKAEKALEKALDDFDGNYTEEERKSLNDRLDTVKAALDAIGNAEKAAEEIKKLPSADDVKLSDKDEIERISKIIDDLTDNEKALIGEDTFGKLKALNEKLTELADNAKKQDSPKTGDTSDLVLWIALLFISGGVITGATVAGKKKKQQDR